MFSLLLKDLISDFYLRSRRTHLKVQKGHTENFNKFHHGSSLRERERDRIIMYGKYSGQFIDCMIYSDQTVRNYSTHVIYMCALKWGHFFLS